MQWSAVSAWYSCSVSGSVSSTRMMFLAETSSSMLEFSTSLPLSRMVTWWQMFCISARLWLEMMMVLFFEYWRMSSRMLRALSGSSPAVGSSRKMTSGFPMNAWQRATRFDIPWLSALADFLAISSSPTILSASMDACLA